MDNRTQMSRGHFSRRFWAATATIALLALAFSACSGDTAPTPIANAVVVESGVAPLTPSAARTDGGAASDDLTDAEVNAESATISAPEVEGDAPASTSGGFPILDVGAEVLARGILRIYAAAEPNVPTLDEYTAGDRFTILGPPDGVTIYPVELAGVRWYRVRAADGLVGWVIADGIEAIANAQPN